MQRLHLAWATALMMLAACGGKPKPEAPIPVSDVPASLPVRPVSDTDGGTSGARDAAAGGAAILAEAIYFGYDEATLSGSARARLDAKAQALRGTPDARLLINGHTDERGALISRP